MYNNNLSSFNIKSGGNAAITEFNAEGNPNLICIQVDDSTYSANNWTRIDAQTSFNEDCSGVPTGINSTLENRVKVFPIPTTQRITISGFDLKEVTLLNSTGEPLASFTEFTIDLSAYTSGIYFLKIQDENDVIIVKRIVKE
jgi:hypothetical protein